jgi:hypothetical protein
MCTVYIYNEHDQFYYILIIYYICVLKGVLIKPILTDIEMSAEDETPVVERKLVLVMTDSPDSDPVDSLVSPMASLTSLSMLVPTPSIRNITRDEADMSQSYHEIFDT